MASRLHLFHNHPFLGLPAEGVRADEEDVMMEGGSIRIGRVAGIPIRIHVTFLIIIPFLAIGFASAYRQAARVAGLPADQLRDSSYLWGLFLALALFVSVLLHELAHSLYAIRVGGRVRDITLLMIGGVSQISQSPKTAGGEAIMALVGPLTSLLLGGAFYVVSRTTTPTTSFGLSFALSQLTYLNLVLGVFNLLPAFPMDGGRILRGVLAGRLGMLRATRIAANAGKVFAALFAILGFIEANLFLVAIAFFVYVGAESESRGVLVKAVLGHIKVRDLVVSRPPSVEPSATVFDVAERMVGDRRTAYPVAQADEVLGVVTLEEVQRVPPSDRSRVPISDVFERIPPVRGEDEASAVMRVFAETRSRVLPVVENRSLFGLLFQTDVARGLQLSELEATQHPSERDESASGYRHIEQHA